MSRHNIIGSEAFDTERFVAIRAYRRRGAGLGRYILAAMGGGLVAVLGAGLLSFASQALGAG